MQREREVERRRVEVAHAGGDRRGEVREIGERDRRGAASDRVVARAGASASTHRVDDEPVLACVLLRANELVGAQPGAGHRPRGHVAAGRRTSSSGLAPTNPPSAYTKHPGWVCVQRVDDRRQVERHVGLDHDLAGEHDLLDRAGVDEREHRGDVRVPFVARR